MNKLLFLTLLVLIATSMGACASLNQEPANEAIYPEDKIGNFLVRTGDQADIANTEELSCSKQGDEEKYICQAAVGTNLNVSYGVYDDQFTGKTEAVWADHTYEMTINGRPVNLQAFGFIDQQHPNVGMMRRWNVVIEAQKPGEITVHYRGVVGGKNFEDTSTYVFTEP